MNVLTFGQILDEVELELDLQNETNIANDEKVNAANDAVQSAMAEICKINEDYFRTSTTINLVSGTSKYSVPTGIYATKLRDILYNNGSDIYKVRRIRGDMIFLDKALTDQFSTTQDYRYVLINDSSTAGIQIQIVPTSRETLSAGLTVWYIRTPNRIPLVSAGSLSASRAIVVDIPEFYTYIKRFMKVRFLMKDGADPRLPEAMAELEKERMVMVDTLTQMVPDDDDEIIADFSHYDIHE